MQQWFSIESIDGQTWVISENQHWEQTHCYLLLGSDKAVLIDTGLGVANIKPIVDSLTDLPVTVITTHVHWDHIGSHMFFDTIAVHEAEAPWLSNFPLPLSTIKANLLRERCNFPDGFDPSRYQIFQDNPSIILKDSDRIELGDRQLLILHTPGHSPGHICLYEPERGYLFSGDLVYKGCLDAFYPTTSPTDFMESLHRLQSFPIGKIFPGHYSLSVSATLIGEIYGAFQEIHRQGKLTQGNGIFDFDQFSLHI